MTDQSSLSVISPAPFGCGETITTPVAVPLRSELPGAAGKAARSLAALLDLWPARPLRRSFPTHSTTKVSLDDQLPKPAYRFAAISTPSIGKSARLHKPWTSIPTPYGAPLKWNASSTPSRCGPPWSIRICRLCARLLEQYPRLRATRIHQMIRDRGYTGSVEQLRRVVARLRPQPHEAFLRLQVFPAEQAQVDWAYFGSVMVGRAKRQLSCFVITLSWSRALYLEFFFDQTTENFLRGHVRAFQDWSGAPRVILYDNLKSAVLERRGDQIHFNPRLLELAAHYHFVPRPCQVRAGNQKGRVERAIRYVRDSFWAGRIFHHSGGVQSPGAGVAG